MQPTGVVDTAKAVNPLKDLLKFGQSVWLDYIRRDLITSGELKRLIDEDGLRGMTSNPAIFEKAIAGSTDYADILQSLQNRTDLDAKARYEQSPFATFRMPPTCCVRSTTNQTPRRLRQPRSLSLSRARYAGHHRRGAPPLESGRPPNVMIKVPGTARAFPHSSN